MPSQTVAAVNRDTPTPASELFVFDVATHHITCKKALHEIAPADFKLPIYVQHLSVVGNFTPEGALPVQLGEIELVDGWSLISWALVHSSLQMWQRRVTAAGEGPDLLSEPLLVRNMYSDLRQDVPCGNA